MLELFIALPPTYTVTLDQCVATTHGVLDFSFFHDVQPPSGPTTASGYLGSIETNFRPDQILEGIASVPARKGGKERDEKRLKVEGLAVFGYQFRRDF